MKGGREKARNERRGSGWVRALRRGVYRLPLQNRDGRAKCAKKETKRSRREKTIKNGERGSRKVWGDTRGDVGKMNRVRNKE